jgi:hypothetical protein
MPIVKRVGFSLKRGHEVKLAITCNSSGRFTVRLPVEVEEKLGVGSLTGDS